MEMLQNPINWFEILVIDSDRAKEFHSAIYDFAMPEYPIGPNRMGILLYDQQKQGIVGAIVKG